MATQRSSDRPVSARPWTSGRVLTPAQRERKRYKDRMSKREKRVKKRDTLKDLQSRVAALHQLLQSHTRCGGPLQPEDERLSYSERLGPGLSPDDSLDGHPSTPSNPEPCTVLASRPSATPFDSGPAPPVSQPLEPWANGQSTTWATISPSLQESGSCIILAFADRVLGKASGLSILDICINSQLNQDAFQTSLRNVW